MTSDLGGKPAEVLLRAAMDAMIDPQATLEAVRDQDGRIRDFAFREVNAAACTFFGLRREQMIESTLIEIAPGVVSTGLFGRCAQCVETGEPIVEDLPYPRRRIPGTRRIEVRASCSDAEWLSLAWRDVTTRFEARHEPVVSGEQFRLIVENASDVVVQFRDYQVVWVSPSVEAALGAPPSYWIGRYSAGLVAEEDLPVFGEMLAEAAGGVTSVHRLRVLDVHDNLRWFEVHTKLHYDAEGRPDGHTAALRPIDDEVAAELAATKARREQAESDARFRRLIENSAIATNLVSPDGRFRVVNKAMCDLVGYDAETLLTMTWRDVRAPDDADDGIRSVVEIMMGQRDSHRSVHQYLHADGRRLWGDLTVSAMRDSDGNVEHLIGQIIDITEQVELREKQAEADARFRRLMETSNVAMALTALDGTMEVVNDALCTLLGYDEEVLITKTWQELTPPEYLQADLDNTVELLAERLDTYRVVKQFIRADGGLVWVDMSASVLRDSRGEVQYIVGQGIDISDAVAGQELLAEQERENRVLADRLQAEMRNAAMYVESILPRALDGPVEVSSRYLPALDLGGDCFHYRWLDDDHLEMYLIDVSGHGIRPAFLSVSVHNLIRSGSLPERVLLNPDLVLDAINGLFPMEDHADSYFTIWYGIYQLSTRTVRYASAGHPPALALRFAEDGVVAEELSTPANPIGMFPDTVYTCASYQVPVGGQLLLYSDGAFEIPATNTHGKPWSREDFVALCTELAAERSDWSLDELVDRLRALGPDGDFDDDCALVLLTFP